MRFSSVDADCFRYIMGEFWTRLEEGVEVVGGVEGEASRRRAVASLATPVRRPRV